MSAYPLGTRVEHERYGIGIIGLVGLTSYDIYFERGGKMQLAQNNDELTILETPEDAAQADNGLDLDKLEEVLIHVMDKYGAWQEEVPMGSRWTGGKLILEPGDDTQPKEIPVETFFHKIVMVRDRLRVLEQNINSNKSLSDEEKVNLQQYITRSYGSLTTFNVLFDDKEHYFVGSKKG